MEQIISLWWAYKEEIMMTNLSFLVHTMKGDSGGPIVDMDGVQVAVVSWGIVSHFDFCVSAF
jgi:secreted trypsin-like serine protease